MSEPVGVVCERAASELDALAAALPGADAHAAAQAAHVLRAPVRIQIAGRAGVGRTTLARVLGTRRDAHVEVAAPVDAPGAPDPVLDAEVVVYVFVDGVRDADRAALRKLDPAGAITVLGKVDTMPDRAAADAAADACRADVGIPGFALDARGAGTSAERHESGFSAVAAAVDVRVRRALAARGARIVRELRARAVASRAGRDALESFVAGDSAVELEAADARGAFDTDALGRGSVGDEPYDDGTADAALRQAAWWRARDASARSAADAIVRQRVRLWMHRIAPAPSVRVRGR
ncbi:hypothetical protein [Rhodococcus sp. HNM0569]|uniref:hypothetical protein n=1 Tax=Rhodococcus sp. HNM0569 TaxID=2716340 RepID=UPI00146CBDA3|nr:hypothetical protein [Rhodococcus sp. HNM0569]NLU83709.1 hypothetical protein [Rhodococcus sp. HNM0569]